jgi:N-acetylmuramoyl-L-alanine amidase
MATKVGEYSVRAGGAAVHFWALAPGTTVAQATPPAPVAPVNPNTIVQPPSFAIFDVVVRLTDEPVAQSAIADPVLLAQVSGMAPSTSMPLTAQADGTARICFAVSPSSGNSFEGALRLSAKRTSSAATIEIDLPIRAAVNTLADGLFVFFVVHPHPPKTYGWAKLRVTQRGGAAPIAGANVQAKILRDGLTFKDVNRTAPLQSGADGYLAHASRNVIGLPIKWPIICNASAAGYVPRGHMIRLAQTDVHDNLAPFVPAASLEMLTTAQASLAGKRILLDPGHGVVYDFAPARRVQEWFVASRLADRIEAVLTSDHGVLAADVLRTRTAGFGLIEPSQMGADDAPDKGHKKFEYDMAGKRIRIISAAATLKELSDLVLTKHADPGDAAQPVPVADRERLLTLNAATLVSIVARLNGSNAPSRRVRRGSIRWDAASSRYLYTHDPIATPGSGGTDAAVPIATSDWFTIDDAMVKNLVERSVRWSLAREIGSGPGASPPRPAFIDAARTALVGAGARDYMTKEVLRLINVAPPHQYLNHGTHGWGPGARMIYINGNICDLYVSLHENAGGGKGGECLVSRLTGVNAPPDEQIRIGKIFIKYLDPFDQGLRSGGVTPEEATNPAGMLHAEDPGTHAVQNTMRDRHAYLELEFMDAVDPADASRYRYESMVGAAFIDRVARQIVQAIVEALLARQSDLDAVTLEGKVSPLW